MSRKHVREKTNPNSDFSFGMHTYVGLFVLVGALVVARQNWPVLGFHHALFESFYRAFAHSHSLLFVHTYRGHRKCEAPHTFTPATTDRRNGVQNFHTDRRRSLVKKLLQLFAEGVKKTRRVQVGGRRSPNSAPPAPRMRLHTSLALSANEIEFEHF